MISNSISLSLVMEVLSSLMTIYYHLLAHPFLMALITLALESMIFINLSSNAMLVMSLMIYFSIYSLRLICFFMNVISRFYFVRNLNVTPFYLEMSFIHSF